jgi:hypothetical protein
MNLLAWTVWRIQPGWELQSVYKPMGLRTENAEQSSFWLPTVRLPCQLRDLTGLSLIGWCGLHVAGEAFMSMFDDDGSDSRKVRRTSEKQKAPRALQALKGSALPKAAAVSAHDGSVPTALRSDAKAVKGRTAATQQPQRPSQPDDIDAILGGSRSTQEHRKAKLAKCAQGNVAMSSVPVVDFSQRSMALSSSQPSKQELARQRKLFMSAKVRCLAFVVPFVSARGTYSTTKYPCPLQVSKVHEVVSVGAGDSPGKGGEGGDDEPSLAPEDFRRIQTEVEKLGGWVGGGGVEPTAGGGVCS